MIVKNILFLLHFSLLTIVDMDFIANWLTLASSQYQPHTNTPEKLLLSKPIMNKKGKIKQQ